MSLRMNQASAIDERQEKMIIILLTAVNFTHILDYMIIMPLGARLIETLHITPAQFGQLVAVYSLAAALSGLAGGFVLDRFERKHALVFLYSGFGLATLACSFASNYPIFLAARFVAGAFGGVAGSVVFAIVSDVVPPERRGRGMGTVMSAFPLASIMGIPLALWLAHYFGWPAPFALLGGLSLLILIAVLRFMPTVPSHPAAADPIAQMRAIVTHPVHKRGFMLSAALVFSGACVIPFMATAMATNHGFNEERLTFIYLIGGAATLVSSQIVGRCADRFDKVKLIAVVSLLAAISAIVVTRLPTHITVAWALLATTGFFVGMASRFPPTMALITNAVEARYRGGFMSVNSAVQQAANSLGSTVAGLFLSISATGELIGYPSLGLISAASMTLTVGLATLLGKAAPQASRPHRASKSTENVLANEAAAEAELSANSAAD